MNSHTNIKEPARKSITQHQTMKTSAPLLEVLHFDPAHSCCKTSAEADLFPDMLHLEINRLNKGRVFGVLVESYGVGVQHREVVVDKDTWTECSKSPNFDRCLQLSMAKLALEETVLRY